MNDVPAKEAGDDQNRDPASATLGRSTRDGRTASLRGAEPAKIGRTFWLFAGAFGLVVFAAIVVVSFLSAANDNARIDRMKMHGIPVTVVVTGCTGNIGGSGSNVTGYTCRGTYTVDAIHYHDIIGSMSTFAVPGTSVRALVDPSRHSTVESLSAVRASTSSPKRYIAPGLLGLVLVALALTLWRVARRPGTAHHTPRESPPPHAP
jgi:hypothetical protein